MRVRARWQCCAGVLSLLLAGAARAADGGDTGMTDLLYRLLNFALLAGVLIYFARTPVRDFFAARRASIETQLSEAAELQPEPGTFLAAWHSGKGAPPRRAPRAGAPAR